LVAGNSVAGNTDKQINSGGIVVASAKQLTGGSNPNLDTIAHNTAYRDHPADLHWDGTGTNVTFTGNYCATSLSPGLCRYAALTARACAAAFAGRELVHSGQGL
jgi:hypothetical protein